MKKLANEKTDGAQPEKAPRKRVVQVVAAVLLLIILLLLLRACAHKQPPAAIVAGDFFPGARTAQDGNLPGMTEEELLAQMQRVADANYFSFKINAAPYFSDGKSPGSLGIENPSYNVFPMVVQIELEDTGEIIYDSGGLLPNQYISQDTLLTVLPAGDYDAVATLYAYDPDSLECKGKSQVQLQITVAA